MAITLNTPLPPTTGLIPQWSTSTILHGRDPMTLLFRSVKSFWWQEEERSVGYLEGDK